MALQLIKQVLYWSSLPQICQKLRVYEGNSAGVGSLTFESLKY